MISLRKGSLLRTFELDGGYIHSGSRGRVWLVRTRSWPQPVTALLHPDEDSPMSAHEALMRIYYPNFMADIENMSFLLFELFLGRV